MAAYILDHLVIFINHTSYADDLNTITPSPIAMQKLLDLCSNYTLENYIIFNLSKTKLINVY